MGAKAAAQKANQKKGHQGRKNYEEDKQPIEEEKRSFRGPREEMKAEPHSQQASRGKISSPSNLPSAADPKNRTQGNWNEEIINTSKEIHGESSHKSRAEMQSNRSSGEVQREESNPNFRSPQ